MGAGDASRGGFVAIPRAWLEAVQRGELTVEQLGTAVLLVGEANYREPTVVPGTDGRVYPVGVGQALVGRRRFAERYRMGKGGRDRVTRALERGNALELWAAKPAEPAPPPEPPPAPRSAPPPAPPPTLVSFKNDAEILFFRSDAAPPPAPPSTPPPAPSPDPIQQGNTEHDLSSLRSEVAPRPSPSRRAKRSDDEETTAARDLRATAERIFLELRAAPYALATRQAIIADRVAARGLLAAAGGDLDAFAARWREALAHEGFPRVDTLADLAKHWARFSPSPAVARRRGASEVRHGDLGVVHGDEWWRRLSAAEQREFLAERQAIDPELSADAPFPATGVASPGRVQELIARFSQRLRRAAGGMT